MGGSGLPGGAQVIFRPFLPAIILVILSAPGETMAAEKGPEQFLLVHVNSPLGGETDRTALVFRVVAAGLKKGQRVALFFDAEGADSLKIGRWFGGHSTPLDRAAIAENERRDLAALLGTSLDDMPDSYGSLLLFLKGRGVAVYVSGRALELRGIDADRFDHAAETVSEEKARDLLGRANEHLSY